MTDAPAEIVRAPLAGAAVDLRRYAQAPHPRTGTATLALFAGNFPIAMPPTTQMPVTARSICEWRAQLGMASRVDATAGCRTEVSV